jgi:hypothetical protein
VVKFWRLVPVAAQEIPGPIPVVLGTIDECLLIAEAAVKPQERCGALSY